MESRCRNDDFDQNELKKVDGQVIRFFWEDNFDSLLTNEPAAASTVDINFLATGPNLVYYNLDEQQQTNIQDEEEEEHDEEKEEEQISKDEEQPVNTASDFQQATKVAKLHQVKHRQSDKEDRLASYQFWKDAHLALSKSGPVSEELIKDILKHYVKQQLSAASSFFHKYTYLQPIDEKFLVPHGVSCSIVNNNNSSFIPYL